MNVQLNKVIIKTFVIVFLVLLSGYFLISIQEENELSKTILEPENSFVYRDIPFLGIEAKQWPHGIKFLPLTNAENSNGYTYNEEFDELFKFLPLNPGK